MQSIIDLHCDTISEIQAGADFQNGHRRGHVDIPRLRRGNIACQIFACYISSVIPSDHAHQEAMTLLGLIDEICTAFSADLEKIGNAKELADCCEQGRIAVLPAVENGHAIANNLKNIERLYMAGSRYMTLTHAKNLDWAASSAESGCAFSGLTPFGEKVITAMNELGMIIDLSHVHESTFWAVLRLSSKPVIASHSNAAAICPIPRNLMDDQIKAIAGTGGMIGINFFPGFLDIKYNEIQIQRCGDLFGLLTAIEKNLWAEKEKKQQAMFELGLEMNNRMADIHVGIEAIVDHIEYIIKLAGDDFVGFGSDFDGLPALPSGVTGCDIFPAIIGLMQARGFSDECIRKISRENFVRVLEEQS